MNEKKQQLLEKLNAASDRLDEYEDGSLAIGQLGLSVQSCIDVIIELVHEVSEMKDDADSTANMVDFNLSFMENER